MDILQGFGDQLLIGAWLTVRLALASVALGLVLGMLLALMKLSTIGPVRWIANGYTDVFRGLPELLVVLMIYFGAEAAVRALYNDVLGFEGYIEIGPFAGGVLALGLIFGAYSSEVFRGAVQSIPVGQKEAATALGMGRFLAFRRIIMPQVWRVAMPGLGNLYLVTLKDTALVSVIGLNELMRMANVAGRNTRDYFTFLMAAAVIYLTLTLISMAVLAWLERRANRGSSSQGGASGSKPKPPTAEAAEAAEGASS
ncbi:MAG: ABC transporter permease [Rhodospirillaceae bacterium]